MNLLRQTARYTELRARFLGLRAVLGLGDRAHAPHDIVGQMACPFDSFQPRRRAQRDLEHLDAARMQCPRDVFALLD